MKRLKILFVTKDFSHYLERNFHYMQLELRKHAEVALDHRGGEIEAILRRAPFQPDFVLFNDMFHASYCPPVHGLAQLKVPWGMIMHDLHARPELRREFMRRFPSANIFTMYRQAFRERYPEFKGRLFWLPHFVEPTVFKDYQRRKNINVLLMGATNPKVYPLRHKMRTALSRHPGFVSHNHPGYTNFGSEPQALVARGFALEVNRSKIFLSCDSIYHYPLRKYFEVPACNTLLLASENVDLRGLGFRHGVHYVAVTERDFLAKIHYYLHPNNESLRAKISRQGYEFVREKHTTSVRTLQLLEMIGSIVA